MKATQAFIFQKQMRKPVCPLQPSNPPAHSTNPTAAYDIVQGLLEMRSGELEGHCSEKEKSSAGRLKTKFPLTARRVAWRETFLMH